MYYVTENGTLEDARKFTVVFIFVYILSFVVEDMDQNARTNRASKYRMEAMKTKLKHEQETKQQIQNPNTETFVPCSCAYHCTPAFHSIYGPSTSQGGTSYLLQHAMRQFPSSTLKVSLFKQLFLLGWQSA
jgi:Na+-transporting methylmalonyl-CoA/oxaloacetate decarboxylase gamma subunit